MKDFGSRLGPQKGVALLVGGLTLILIIIGVANLILGSTQPVEELSRQASEARLGGDNEKALKLYRLVSARSSPFDYSSNYELGNIYQEREDWGKAAYYYRKAASNPSAPAGVFYQLSDLYLNHLQARADDFIRFMEKQAGARQDDESIRIVLADFYRQRGDKDKALEWYRKALELTPNNEAIQQTIRELEGSL